MKYKTWQDIFIGCNFIAAISCGIIASMKMHGLTEQEWNMTATPFIIGTFVFGILTLHFIDRWGFMEGKGINVKLKAKFK